MDAIYLEFSAFENVDNIFSNIMNILFFIRSEPGKTMWTSNPLNIVRTKLSVALQIKSNMWVSFFLFALEHNFLLTNRQDVVKRIYIYVLYGDFKMR